MAIGEDFFKDDILDKVNLGQQISVTQQEILRSVFRKFRNIFPTKDKPIGLTKIYCHKIDTGNQTTNYAVS